MKTGSALDLSPLNRGDAMRKFNPGKLGFMSRVALLLIVMAMGAVAEDLPVKVTAPWTKHREDGGTVYSLAVTTGWPKLTAEVDTKAGSYYRVTWKMKSSIGGRATKTPFQLTLTPDGEQDYSYGFSLSPEWESYAAYFYAKGSTRFKMDFFINPETELTVSLKNIEISEVGVDQFKENMLPDGNFENGLAVPAAWKANNREGKFQPPMIAPLKDFTSGEKSLCVEMDGAGEIASIYLPVELGRSVSFKFWAKADQECQITAIIQGYAVRHTGSHFYKGKKLKVDTDWKEYEVTIEVPTETDKYPDLLYKTMYLCLGWGKEAKGKIYFDEMSFTSK